MEELEPTCPECGSNEIVIREIETVQTTRSIALYRHDDGSVSDVERSEIDREVMDTERADCFTCNDCSAVIVDAEDLAPHACEDDGDHHCEHCGEWMVPA